jgi:hypothetical protein
MSVHSVVYYDPHSDTGISSGWQVGCTCLCNFLTTSLATVRMDSANMVGSGFRSAF